MPQRAIRFSEATMKSIDGVTRDRGFASATAFIRYAVDHRPEDLTGAEERIAATLGQVRKDVFRVARAQQALFAYLDTLAKALLTCVPEPPVEAKPQAIARARERYDRLIKSAARHGRGTRVGNEGSGRRPGTMTLYCAIDRSTRNPGSRRANSTKSPR